MPQRGQAALPPARAPIRPAVLGAVEAEPRLLEGLVETRELDLLAAPGVVVVRDPVVGGGLDGGGPLQRAGVGHGRDDARVDVATQRPFVLAAANDPLEARERLPDLVELVLDVRAARDLANEQPHEVGIGPPRAQDDLDHELELLRLRLPRILGERDGCQQPPPLLTEDGFENGVLGAEVVVDEAVGNTGFPRHVTDPRGFVALRREDAHGRREDLPALVLRGPHDRATLRRGR